MIPVLTAAEMGQADRRTIQECGIPGAVLMENAGAAVAAAIRQRFPAARRLVVLCGRGNNGGDGFVAAKRLSELQPAVYLAGSRSDVKGDARTHMEAYAQSGGMLAELGDVTAWQEARETVQRADLVVDALLGTGLRDAPAGLVAQIIQDLAQSRTAIVAVDVPSGLPSDTGEVPWQTVRAALTVTFAAPKVGHVLPPACERVGELMVADIGIPPAVLAGTGTRLWLLEAGDAARAFPRREPGAHKGTFGHVLVVAGSVGKTGAAVLSACGALRAGAGLVTVATAAPALPLVAAGRPELMTEALPVSGDGELDRQAIGRALALADKKDAVVLGPGLGQAPATRDFIRAFVAECAAPLVIDADGLNALAPSRSSKEPAAAVLQKRSAATVVTPHPGEMARLLGSDSATVQKSRLQVARGFAAESRATVVLKGYRTVVAEPAGRAAVNPTGNPGMATGGTGDVLSGILGALLARGLDPWTAAAAGVYVHGLAGDVAARRLGQESLLAGDLVEALPEAIRSVGHADS
jgi:ADP-dependent NAD(P)H-hydrate dehydratase / NAD(P)H-hydrate epimerase